LEADLPIPLKPTQVTPLNPMHIADSGAMNDCCCLTPLSLGVVCSAAMDHENNDGSVFHLQKTALYPQSEALILA
jgi:hypothetical protein